MIFATGSKAFVIPVPGSTLPSVIGWRTIDDTEQMMNIAKTKKKAIVIGGGLLGLECTWFIRSRYGSNSVTFS